MLDMGKGSMSSALVAAGFLDTTTPLALLITTSYYCTPTYSHTLHFFCCCLLVVGYLSVTQFSFEVVVGKTLLCC